MFESLSSVQEKSQLCFDAQQHLGPGSSVAFEALCCNNALLQHLCRSNKNLKFVLYVRQEELS